MKKICFFIVILLVALVSCKKTPKVNQVPVIIVSNMVTVDSTTANFQCIFDYDYTLKGANLFYGENADETNLYCQEMQIVQDTLKAELTGLKENTTYNYYYVFFNGFNSMQTESMSFQTH